MDCESVTPTQGATQQSVGCESLTPTQGAQKMAEMLRHPCILGDPQQRGTKVERPPHPCLLGGPKEGGNATSPLHSWGSPRKGSKTKSEVATSPLPSRGPKRGRKCYVTPAFSGVTNVKRRDRHPQSSYMADSILGTLHKGTICGGKRPKKVRIVTKIGGKGCIGVYVTQKLHVCMHHYIACIPG